MTPHGDGMRLQFIIMMQAPLPFSTRTKRLTTIILLAVLFAIPPVHVNADPATPPAATQPASQSATQPATQAASDSESETPQARLPHIRINREKKWIDFDAKVVLRDGKWIELLVCTPGSREYESILTTEAKPSHLHLALLILGQTPGSPMSWKRQSDQILPILPTGPLIEVSIHYLKDDKPFSIPAGQWVMDHQTNAPLPSSQWLFAGSKFMSIEGRPIYTADVNGSCLSLVNFGDELLAWPTDKTNQNDGGQLGANTKLIPPIGTPVVVRLTPIQPANEKPASDTPEVTDQDTSPATAPTTQPAEKQ